MVAPPPPPDAAPAGTWHRVVTEVPDHDVELASDELWQAGCAGIEEQPAGGGRTRLLAGFPDRASAALGARRVAATVGVEVAIVPVDDDGLDGWRRWARSERAGRFWLTPTWVAAPELAPGEEVLWLDPGRSFGSGSHATTRLVVRALEDLVARGGRVLDVGCGSGVLAIAAARLGAGAVDAIDIDPGAPAITMANAERNGVAERVRASSATLGEVVASGARFDLVAANLLAPVVADLAPQLVEALAPGGVLAVSGLLADRWEASVPPLAPLVVLRTDIDDGWAAVVLGRPPAADR